MRRFFQIALTVFGLALVAQACAFKTEDAALQRFYRSAGWSLPSIRRGQWSAPVILPSDDSSATRRRFGPGPVPGLTARVIVDNSRDREPIVFEVPRQEFEQDGKRRVMPYQMMSRSHWIWRYEIDGKVVAYTFGFTPVEAHKIHGKWKIDASMMCDFDVTFIDDQGDGVFRLLAPGWMTPDLVPRWAAKRDPS